MKLLITLLAFYIALPVNAQETFKAISYNIRWNNLADDLDQWDDRKEAMGNFLEEERPDFLGLQEVLDDQLYFLSKYLEVYEPIGVARDDGDKKGEYCPIFYSLEKWQLIENETIWLSATPNKVSIGWDAACNRIVTYGLFVHKESGDTIAVFNTHFDHVGSKARQNSVTVLSDFVKSKSKSYAFIIMGDFNLIPDSDIYKSLSKHFQDSREIANHRYEEHQGTFNGFSLLGNFNRRIDYIFTNNSLEVLLYDCPDLRIDGRHLSDHFPVIVVMKFTNSD